MFFNPVTKKDPTTHHNIRKSFHGLARLTLTPDNIDSNVQVVGFGARRRRSVRRHEELAPDVVAQARYGAAVRANHILDVARLDDKRHRSVGRWSLHEGTLGACNNYFLFYLFIYYFLTQCPKLADIYVLCITVRINC